MKPTAEILSGILSLLIAVAGWFYMFYSRAAHRLGVIESAPANLRRIRLRRINGFAMFLLAVGLFAGVWSVDPKRTPSLFVFIWVGVFLLLFVVVVLALIDVRLTARLRRGDTAKPKEESL